MAEMTKEFPMTKKTYQINTSRGVDLTSSPLNVSPSRASYMRNMINDGGVNKKRHGWNEIAYFEDADGKALNINGIWEYVHPIDKTRWLVVYAGTQFFKCDFEFKVQEEITVEGSVNGQKCKAYYKDGLLWIIGCGDYLVYDGTSIVKIEDSKYVYVPTISVGITTDGKMENFEDLNLLTNWRKNKLVGDSGYTEISNAYSSTYSLDGLVDFSKGINITVEISIGKGENEVDIIANYDDQTGSVLGRVVLEYAVNEEKTDTNYIKATYKGRQVTLKQEDDNGVINDYIANIYMENWPNCCQIDFKSNVITPIQGYSNITVEYFADYERDIDLTASAVYTQGNGVDLLLVANRGNAIFYNGLDSADCEYSFGYIPVEKFITFGSDRDEITAIVPMADCVGVFKGKNFYRVGFTFNTDSEAFKAEYVPQITVSTESKGCVNQYVCCDVNGDTLIFDGASVYGIDFSEQQRSLRLRSSNINKVFEKYTKSVVNSSVALEHEGRYYLFIGGDVYIGDSRFKVYESNRLDTSFEYEWWVWDNCDTSVAYSIGGKLYIGRENGKIAVFDKEYKDRELLVAKSIDADVACECEYRRSFLTFNENLGVGVGDKVKISGACQQIGWDVPMIREEECAKFQSEIVDGGYIGKKIILGSTKKECEIIDFVVGDTNNYFVTNATDFNDNESIYCSIEGKKFTLDNYEDKLCLKDDVGFVCLAEFDNFEVIIERNNNVECEYHTPALDLGSNLCLKTLNQLLITVSSDTEGQIEVGYQTNKNNRFLERKISTGFEFNNFDFNTLSFDCFYKTHIKRVFERNFNYILFKFASRSDSAFGVENFNCVYSTNNQLLKSDK